MTAVNPEPAILQTFELNLRVRYQETDAQGRVHHSNYLNYFEVARVEMLRASGRNYKHLEADGVFLVVSHASCNYFRGAEYDDLLRVVVRIAEVRKTRIVHEYDIFRDEELMAQGRTVVAAVTPAGKVTRLPAWLQPNPKRTDRPPAALPE